GVRARWEGSSTGRLGTAGPPPRRRVAAAPAGAAAGAASPVAAGRGADPPRPVSRPGNHHLPALPPQMLVGSAPTPRSLTTPPTSATLPPPCPRSPAATPPATVKLSPGRRAARSRPRSVHRGYPTSPPPFPRCETRHV